MRAPALLLVVLAACRSSSAPEPLNVTARLDTRVVGTGCAVTWTAHVSDPAMPIRYRIGPADSAIASGAFYDSTVVTWTDAADPVTVSWTVALVWDYNGAPRTYWQETHAHPMACGTTWTEP